MENPNRFCSFCEGDLVAARSDDYWACSLCRHEALRQGDVQSHIVNDDLQGKEKTLKKTGLDTFQSKVLDQTAIEREVLLDVGCSTGRFLSLNGKTFRRSVGVEVTKECIEYARVQRGLEVYERLPLSLPKLSVVTLWHSLEHVPFSAMHEIFSGIRELSAPHTRLIISVPCVDGLQYRWFGRRFAFYDVPSHVSQFSRTSLLKLLEKYGFSVEKEFFSGPYIGFGYIQGVLNYLNRTHNYFYYRLKRGNRFGHGRAKLFFLDLYNLAATLVALPVSIPFTLWERLWPKQRSVVTLVFKPIV